MPKDQPWKKVEVTVKIDSNYFEPVPIDRSYFRQAEFVMAKVQAELIKAVRLPVFIHQRKKKHN